MEKLALKVKRLQLGLGLLVAINVFLLISAFSNKVSQMEKFDVLTVGRINVVDSHGTLKLALSSNDHWKELRNSEQNQSPVFSGMLFYNEEGQECGGLIYRGKKTKGGQEAGAGLMFDQFNQDQNIALQHSESVDSTESSVDDGLAVNQRPDYKKMEKEFNTYDKIAKMSLSQGQKDSLRSIYADQDIIFSRRLFIGTKRGVRGNKPFNETGLFIKNKAGNQAIRIFVDYDNVPHFEVYDADGKRKIYGLDLKEQK